jgi:ABC-type sugar transport system ATPase subunit
MSASAVTHETPPTAGTLLRASVLSKAFGPTQALCGASFDLRDGEVHALLGENGSGKSTLVKILSGVHVPDTGSIEFAGGRIEPARTPREAQRRGIVTVFQEVLVAGASTVVDNVWLGAGGLLRARVPHAQKRAQAAEALTALLGRPLDLDTRVEELSLSERQACSIVRALLRRPKVLILDEATSALDFATRDRLFELLRGLRAERRAIVLITHRLDEIAAIADRITVLRSGATVATVDRGACTSAELVRLMTGADQLTAGSAQRTRAAGERQAPALTVRGLRLRPGCRPIDVEIRRGELVGLAGLEGHGQDAFLDALRGELRSDGAVLRHDGATTTPIRGRRRAGRSGIAYVPRDRGQALFSWMSIRENFAMPTLARDSAFGWLRPEATRARLARYVTSLRIALDDQDAGITTLSGGNQQKVVIARWLAADPSVLLLNDPTRGVDIGAKRDLYAVLGDLADHGMAVVMLSTELDEHIELMDRVLVFRESELFGEIPKELLSRHALMSALFGQRDATKVSP